MERETPFRTEAEAATYLRVTPKTLKNYRYRGDGPKYRKHGGRVVYHIDDLQDYCGVSKEFADRLIRIKRGE